MSEKFETAAQATALDLKSFITAELDHRFTAISTEMDRRFTAISTEMDRRFTAITAEMNLRFAEMEARFERSLRVQLATILSAIVGVAVLAVTIIKLF